MGRWLREHWQKVIYPLLGYIPLLVIEIMWLLKIPVPLTWQGQPLEHEPLRQVLATLGSMLAGGILLASIVRTRTTDKNNPSQSPADCNRADLLEAVDQIWLKGLLDNLLNQDKDFQIKLAFLQPEKVAQQYGGQPYPLKDNRAVLQTFEDFGRKLVLLGEPGAGKTVLLLQLARQLHAKAVASATEPIPVIFPLSSWAQKQLPFHEWLQGELRDRYGASPKLAETLVAGERLIYLLDGLDEVNAEQREACLQAIKTFVENPKRHIEYMLCSRQIEFVKLQTRLDVPGEIVLQLLSWDAIQHYVQGDEFAALRTLLNGNTILRDDFARIPFMLNTMAYVTQGDSIEKVRLALKGKTDSEDLRTYFLDAYVTKRLRARVSAKYPADKTRHWLRWLAGQLVKEKQEDFYVENLQPSYLELPSKIIYWEFGSRLLSAIFVGLMTSISWLSVGIIAAFINAIIYGSLFLFFAKIIQSSRNGSRIAHFIKTVDQVHFAQWRISLSQVVNGIKAIVPLFPYYIVIWLGTSTFCAIAVVIISLFSGELSINAEDVTIKIVERFISVFANGLVGIAAGFVGLFFTFGMLGYVKNAQSIRFRNNFAEGIFRSLINGIVVGGAFGIIFGLTVGFAFWGFTTLLASLFCLYFGLSAFLQHYTLRHMLANAGHLPRWRYDKFLDYAAQDLLILRKVGGGYRFTHDYLRQHLAASASERSQG